jgi:hypothetical protein
MSYNPMSALWARTALAWFLVTVSFGMFMGITQEFSYAPAHAHMGVLGWLSSAVFGFLYALTGERAPGARLAKSHWAVHNLGVALMTGALAVAIGGGRSEFSALIPVGATLVVLSAYWMAVMMWPRLGRPRP